MADADGVFHNPRSGHAHTAVGGCLICRQPRGHRHGAQTVFPAQMSAAMMDQVARSSMVSAVSRGIKLTGLTEKLASLRGRGRTKATRRAERDLRQSLEATRQDLTDLAEVASGAES